MRMTLLVLAILTASMSRAMAQPEETVLFVCEHGAAKSVVAAAHFNRLAERRGLPFRAVARGTTPDVSIPGRIGEGLERDGLRLPRGFVPTAVSGGDIAAASRIITFDVRLPTIDDATRVVRWDALPAFADDYDAASQAIAARVESLIRELEKARKTKPTEESRRGSQ